MAKAGRPEILTEQKQETLCALVAVGVSRRQAALQLGCCPSTVNKRFACDRNFRQRLQAAEGKRRVNALESLGQHSQRSWRAAVWILENTCPEFAKKTRRDELMIQRVFDGVVDAVFDVVRDDRMRDEILERLKHLPLDEFTDDTDAEREDPKVRPEYTEAAKRKIARKNAERFPAEVDDLGDEELDDDELDDDEFDDDEFDDEVDDDDEYEDDELDDELDDDLDEDEQVEALGHKGNRVGDSDERQDAASVRDGDRRSSEPVGSSPPTKAAPPSSPQVSSDMQAASDSRAPQSFSPPRPASDDGIEQFNEICSPWPGVYGSHGIGSRFERLTE